VCTAVPRSQPQRGAGGGAVLPQGGSHRCHWSCATAGEVSRSPSHIRVSSLRFFHVSPTDHLSSHLSRVSHARIAALTADALCQCVVMAFPLALRRARITRIAACVAYSRRCAGCCCRALWTVTLTMHWRCRSSHAPQRRRCDVPRSCVMLVHVWRVVCVARSAWGLDGNACNQFDSCSGVRG
jgi:hypothetical protein